MRSSKLLWITLVALCATSVQIANAQEQPVVTVRWLVDASADAAAQQGRVTVPIVDPAGDCLAKFSITGITTWIVQQKGTNDVADVRSELTVSLRKLFEGPLPLPEITVIRSIDDSDLPGVISFRESRAVASESWRAANAEFTERFADADLGPPSTWKRIELRCSSTQ